MAKKKAASKKKTGSKAVRKVIEFKADGPFPIAFETAPYGRSFDEKFESKFWSKAPSFKGKIGCYVFVLGNKPFYVGKATKSFGQEVFALHKLVMYQKVLVKYKGKPEMYLISHSRAGGRGAAPVKVISQMEKVLTGLAHEANENLCNSHNLIKQDRFRINGVYNSGQGAPSASATRLRNTLKPR